MDKCEKCGAKVGKKATFCPKCGEKIERELGAIAPKGYVNIKVFIVGVVVAAVIGFIAVFVPVSVMKGTTQKKIVENDNNESKADDKEDSIAQPTDENKEDVTDQSTDENKENPTSQVGELEGNSEEVIEKFNYVHLDRAVALKEGKMYEMYPEIYSFLMYDDELFEKIESNSEVGNSFNYSGINFLKYQPRDVIEIDYRYEDMLFTGIEGAKYSDDLTSMQILKNIPEDAYAVCNNGTVTIIKQEYLMTLEPGYYEFNFNFQRDNNSRSTRVLLIIHDESVNTGLYRPQYSNGTQFYSIEKKNDIMFYLNSGISPIDSVLLDYKPVDKQYYEIICDGYGIIFSSEFFELYKDKPYLEMIISTESGLKSDIKVANISE